MRHQTYPKPCLGAGATQFILGLDCRRNGCKSPLPWGVQVESSEGEHLHNPIHTEDIAARHRNSYNGLGTRCPWKEGVALKAHPRVL